ncbi:MAG TPA: hypothetical protein PKN33_16885 [Phycisphaerae bacterium]|nr:hypothetical protein [Phycisphaerae bacterium]
MAQTLLKQLQSLVAQLQSERQAHVEAIAEIDDSIASLGISLDKSAPRKRRGRGATRTKRRKYKTTANEFVLATIKKAGTKGATGARISKAWKAAGRPGNPYNTLGTLTQAKKIKRQKKSGKSGSVFRVV